MAPAAIAAAAFTLAGWTGWALASALLGLVVLFFFRIPARSVSRPDDEVLAPAAGRVIGVDIVEAADLGVGSFHRVVTFLSLFDVHVQRAPVEGKVLRTRHSPGKKTAAFRPRAGQVNEQLLTVLQRANGDLVGVRQVAGLLARRVVSYLEPGQRVRRGDLMGVIKFGSRVDLLIPVSYHLEVDPGRRVREGHSTIARATPTHD